MIESQYDGETIQYIDHLRLQHEGVIIGQDESGEFVYVQSTAPGVTESTTGWHFKVKADLIPGMIVQ